MNIHCSSLSSGHSQWNCFQVNATEPTWWQVNIGLGNGLFPSSNKPLPEPMLIQIYNAIWHHKSTMSWIDICRIWIASPNRPNLILEKSGSYQDIFVSMLIHKNSHAHISRPHEMQPKLLISILHSFILFLFFLQQAMLGTSSSYTVS